MCSLMLKADFYASQDADVTPDDEGGYFTWTEKDIRAPLTEENSEYFLFTFSMKRLDASRCVKKGIVCFKKCKRILPLRQV